MSPTLRKGILNFLKTSSSSSAHLSDLGFNQNKTSRKVILSVCSCSFSEADGETDVWYEVGYVWFLTGLLLMLQMSALRRGQVIESHSHPISHFLCFTSLPAHCLIMHRICWYILATYGSWGLFSWLVCVCHPLAHTVPLSPSHIHTHGFNRIQFENMLRCQSVFGITAQQNKAGNNITTWCNKATWRRCCGQRMCMSRHPRELLWRKMFLSISASTIKIKLAQLWREWWR